MILGMHVYFIWFMIIMNLKMCYSELSERINYNVRPTRCGIQNTDIILTCHNT